MIKEAKGEYKAKFLGILKENLCFGTNGHI